MERRAFEKPLEILERNKLMENGARAMLVAGPLLLAAFFFGVCPPGFLGFHITAFGIFLWLGTHLRNLRAKRLRANMRADREGIWVDGKLAVPRAKIADGFFQPRPGRDPNKAGSYGSSVRIVDKRRRILFEAEAEEREALDVLYALGLDPGSKRAEFNGSSPFYATLFRNMLFVFGSMGAMLAITFALATAGVTVSGALPLLMIPLIFGGMWPSKIAVGVDGLLLRWMWRKKFIPMSQIASVDRAEERVIRLRLVDGREELLYSSMRGSSRWRSSFAVQHRDAILARIAEALAAFRARGPAADVSALVGQGTRTRAEWLAALGKLRDVEGGYRDAVVREEDLWRVVEDPSAQEDARGGAALLLRRSLDDAGKARVRVAAEATASPKLRVALDAAAAEEEDEAALQAALEELATKVRT